MPDAPDVSDDAQSGHKQQIAADREQAASDHSLACGLIHERAHALRRDIRQRTARQRQQTTQARLDTADAGAAVSHARSEGPDAISLA